MQISTEHVIRFIEGIAARIKEHRDELTRLDSAIGDADHGINLDRGFTAVLGKLPTVADKDIGTILKTTGMTLVSTVGGASGPLYGTAFIRAGMALADRCDKTMVDAIGPGIDALKEAVAGGEDFVAATRKAVAATEAGMKATIP